MMAWCCKRDLSGERATAKPARLRAPPRDRRGSLVAWMDGESRRLREGHMRPLLFAEDSDAGEALAQDAGGVLSHLG